MFSFPPVHPTFSSIFGSYYQKNTYCSPVTFSHRFITQRLVPKENVQSILNQFISKHNLQPLLTGSANSLTPKQTKEYQAIKEKGGVYSFAHPRLHYTFYPLKPLSSLKTRESAFHSPENPRVYLSKDTAETVFQQTELAPFSQLPLIEKMRDVIGKHKLPVALDPYQLLELPGAKSEANITSKYCMVSPNKMTYGRSTIADVTDKSVENLRRMSALDQELVAKSLITLIQNTGAVLSLDQLYFFSSSDRSKSNYLVKILPRFLGNFITHRRGCCHSKQAQDSLEKSRRVSLSNLIYSLKKRSHFNHLHVCIQYLEKAYQKELQKTRSSLTTFFRGITGGMTISYLRFFTTLATFGAFIPIYWVYSFLAAFVKAIKIRSNYLKFKKIRPDIKKRIRDAKKSIPFKKMRLSSVDAGIDPAKENALFKKAYQIAESYYLSVQGIVQ
ncbi:MAG: hypothetical protein AAGI90_05070 [Chlamydiota bacterium]